MVKWIKSVWKWFLKNQRKNSDEYFEEEEFDKHVEKILARMNRNPLVKGAGTREDRAQIALMVENSFTQKKMTEVNNSLKIATWFLAIATLIFAYTVLVDSPNKGLILGNLIKILDIFFIIGIVIFIYGILNIFYRFIIRIMKKKK